MMDFRRQKAGQYVARFSNRFSIIRQPGGSWFAYDANKEDTEGFVGAYEKLSEAKSALSQIKYAEERTYREQARENEQKFRAEKKAKEEREREERLAASINLRNTGVFAQLTITRNEALKLIKELADDAEEDTVTLFLRSSEVYVPKDEPGRPERLDISVGSSGWTVARAQIVDSMIVDFAAREAQTA